MAVYLSKEKIAEIFTEYAGSPTNTGDTKGQVALFTYRIEQLTKHLETNRKDFSCKRTLLTLVGRRKKTLNYLKSQNSTEYRELLKRLKIRG
jgi:small subunit ribosomal protein S15